VLVLPEIILDDVRFQELVNEARTRITRHSPDWTEHNVSDPGITLIELFAWFTEILTYRINRIPERLHVGLLRLVGVEPDRPQQAMVDLRFILDAAGGGFIPAQTEVASPRTATDDSVVFQTRQDLVIPAHRLTACALERAGRISAVATAEGTAGLAGRLAAPFGDPPAPDAAILLGFDEPIGGLVIRVDVDCPSASDRHVDPDGSPLVWETPADDGQWHEASVIVDETRAFRRGGAITIDLPETVGVVRLAGKELRWLRCRLTGSSRPAAQPFYARAPRLSSLRAAVVGATVAADHAATIREELIGASEGISGTSYRLRHPPVLEFREGETLEIRERGDHRWISWRHVETFAGSASGDRHFHVDGISGELRFGPAIRQPDGGWRRHGDVPRAGAIMRFSRYRQGGGRAGNVAPRTLSVLRDPIAGVASVTNPRAAGGGIEGESLELARDRARLEIRSRSRAVTAEDFERLTVAASPQVARAICVAPDHGRPIRVHVLPRVSPADRRLDPSELTPSEELMHLLASALDHRRLLGTSIRLLPVRLKGVSVLVEVRASPLSDLDRVKQDVEHALYVYLNPIIGGSTTGPGGGWPRGRAVNLGELFGIVYGIAGVDFVNALRMYETNIVTGEQVADPTDSQLMLGTDELIASGTHTVKAVHPK
jgi:predicted phage baseplate assembly protein